MRMYDWKSFFVSGDSQEYFECKHPKGRIVCAKQDEMGMTASATSPITVNPIYIKNLPLLQAVNL